MPGTKPQFALPFTVGGTATIRYTDGVGVTTLAVNVTSATRYNDRTLATATDAWAYLIDTLNTADITRTYAATEPTTGLSGRCTVTESAITDARIILDITLSAGLTGQMFGFDSDVITFAGGNVLGPTGGSATGDHQRQHLWIARGALAFFAGHWDYKNSLVVEPQSNSGDTTRDDYGGPTLTPIAIARVPGCLVLRSHVTTELVLAIDGLAADDPNVTWEALAEHWRQNDISARYWPDDTDLATHYTLRTLSEGLGSALRVFSGGAAGGSTAPLLYNFSGTGVTPE